MQVNVIGLGYIGLPTALIVSAHGADVIGTDLNQQTVEKLQSGVLTFQEDGLAELFSKARNNGILFSKVCKSAQMYIVCVPTPYNKVSKRINPDFVISAVRDVLRVCGKGAVIVIESTMPPGTIDRYVRPLIAETNADVHLAHAPERIIPGNMIWELENNSRTIGADSPIVAEEVRKVYATFCRGEIVLTDIRTAEMSKVVENTFRDINIAFANELLKICREDGLDVHEVIRIANKHPRVSILSPGPGVGGHCISVDPWFLVGDYPEQSQLIRKARETNDGMPGYVLQRISDIAQERGIASSRIGFYGLTYKEDVSDIRESPTIQLIEMMRERLSPAPKCFDPLCGKRLYESQYAEFDDFLREIDMLVIMVSHNHLRENWERVKKKLIFDTRNSGLKATAGNEIIPL